MDPYDDEEAAPDTATAAPEAPAEPDGDESGSTLVPRAMLGATAKVGDSGRYIIKAIHNEEAEVSLEPEGGDAGDDELSAPAPAAAPDEMME